jgi:hypothetical protein
MTINQHLKKTVFGPAEVKIITAAFEGACKTLGLVEKRPFNRKSRYRNHQGSREWCARR